MNIAVFDIETSTIPALVLDISEIFCIAIKLNDEETKCYTSTPLSNSDGNLDEAMQILRKADLIVGHNIAKFDIPVLEKFYGKIKNKIVDTLIDAKLVYPKDELVKLDTSLAIDRDLIGSYSLKAFGQRFSLSKLNYTDFTHLCEDMVTYCKRDVDLTYKLYNHLITRSNYPSSYVRECEYRVARIIFDQQEYGFWFDYDKARKVATKLQYKAMGLEHKLKRIFKPIFVADGDEVIPKKSMNRKVIMKTTKPVSYFFHYPLDALSIDRKGCYKRYKGKLLPYPFRIVIQHYEEGCSYQKIKLQSFNPNSRTQIASRLMSQYNWIPLNYTEKGNVVINEEILGG